MSRDTNVDPIEPLVDQDAGAGVAQSSVDGASRFYPGFAMKTPTTTAPASITGASAAVDTERELSVTEPVSSDLVTVSQL